MRKQEHVPCSECVECKPQKGLKDGVKWGICDMSGNIVYLEPRKVKRINGNGWIHYPKTSCGLYKK